ncbi:probable chitinase 10 [Sitophilus oryzae]|uniref:Probable chitinase 10 n=1 Tax=Sitophilus oryzae TaxID=7048 RepID=A0A6J2X2I3_SITOR|nr:probable chitinase 10 [Sitophilus oryzae]
MFYQKGALFLYPLFVVIFCDIVQSRIISDKNLPQLDLNTKCLKPRGQFQGTSCQSYVSCWDGVVIEQNCPEGLLFNPIKLYCDYPYNVQCQATLSSNIPETPTWTNDYINNPLQQNILNEVTGNSGPMVESGNIVNQGVSSLSRFCLKDTGLFPGSSCQKYVNCWNGNVVEQDCPGNLLFNPVTLNCDHPFNVKCDLISNNATENLNNNIIQQVEENKPIDNVSQTISNPINQNLANLRRFCLKETGLYPGSSCNKFVNCWNGNAIEQECPTGLYFSKSGFCDYPENVNCGPENNNKEFKNSLCPEEHGIYRNDTFCDKYYVCAFGRVATQYQCPEGFSFSQNLGVCDYSYRVDCGNTSTSEASESDTIADTYFQTQIQEKEKHPKCTKILNGLVRDEENCSIYYLCDSEKVVATYECPAGTLYSNELGTCDYAYRVNCNKGNINKIEPYKPQLSSELMSQVQNCVPGATIPLNFDCSKACRCRKNGAEIIECPAGLFYDSKSNKCLSSALAKC